MDSKEAYEKHLTKIPVKIMGKIIRILPDDHEGTHHQKFVVETPSHQTLLVAHNVERAYALEAEVGDTVEVQGTYVWNKQGGIIHNTHHDDREACEKKGNGEMVCGPQHEDGWVVFVGKKDPHRIDESLEKV